jgi:hypothetical protein
MHKNKALLIVGIIILIGVSGGGVWAWSAFLSDDRPQFQAVTLEPGTLRFVGGQVQVQAQVVDDAGVERVNGMVLSGGQEQAALEVTQPEGSPREFTYQAAFQIPANTHSNGVPVSYTVRLVAVDTAGQESAQEATFEVPAPAAPPLPPQ